MKKKILITLTYYTPYQSGLTLAAKNLAELLAQNGYKVSILTTQHDKTTSEEESLNKVKVIRMPYLFKISKGFFYSNLFGTAYTRIQQNDCVIINLPQFEGVVIAAIAKLLKKKIFSYYHCTVELNKSFVSNIIAKLLHWSNRLTLHMSDTIIATSQDFAMHDQLLHTYKSKVVAIHPIVHDLPATGLSESLANKLPKDKVYKIGFVGRFASEKGIEYLLESVSDLRRSLGDKFVILLAGSSSAVGEEVYVKKIFNLIKKYNASVVYLGKLENDELGIFYKQLNVLVVASVNNTEAFGMVQIEAMRLGIPVIATDLPGVRMPVLTTGMGEIVPVKSSKKIAEAIIKVLKNPEKYSRDKNSLDVFSNDKALKAFDQLLTASEKL